MSRPEQPVQHMVRVSLRGGKDNATYSGTLLLPNPVPVMEDVTDLAPGELKDPTGASYYVIAVVLVYGFSIVMLIASHIKRKHAKLVEDRQINKYLQEFMVVQEKSSRDSYRHLKRSIMAKLHKDKGHTTKHLSNALFPMMAIALPNPVQDEQGSVSNLRKYSLSARHSFAGHLPLYHNLDELEQDQAETSSDTPVHDTSLDPFEGLDPALSDTSFHESEEDMLETESDFDMLQDSGASEWSETDRKLLMSSQSECDSSEHIPASDKILEEHKKVSWSDDNMDSLVTAVNGVRRDTNGVLDRGQQLQGTQDTNPHSIKLKDNKAKDNTGQNSVAKDSAGQNSVAKDNSGQYTVAKDSAGQNSVAKDNSGQYTVAKDSAGQNSVAKDNSAQNRVVKGNTEPGTVIEDSTTQSRIVKDSISQNIVAKDSLTRDRVGIGRKAMPHVDDIHSLPPPVQGKRRKPRLDLSSWTGAMSRPRGSSLANGQCDLAAALLRNKMAYRAPPPSPVHSASKSGPVSSRSTTRHHPKSPLSRPKVSQPDPGLRTDKGGRLGDSGDTQQGEGVWLLNEQRRPSYTGLMRQEDPELFTLRHGHGMGSCSPLIKDTLSPLTPPSPHFGAKLSSQPLLTPPSAAKGSSGTNPFFAFTSGPVERRSPSHSPSTSPRQTPSPRGSPSPLPSSRSQSPEGGGVPAGRDCSPQKDNEQEHLLHITCV